MVFVVQDVSRMIFKSKNYDDLYHFDANHALFDSVTIHNLTQGKRIAHF